MAKPPRKPKDEDIELAPDAWVRFEKTIDSITKTPPKPKKGEGRNKRPPAKK